MTFVFQTPQGSASGSFKFPLTASGQTTDTTPTTIFTFVPSEPGVYTFYWQLSTYNVTSDIGAGNWIEAAIRFDGVTSVLCDVPVQREVPEGTMFDIDSTMTVSGANMNLTVTGYNDGGDQTIKWVADGYYTFVSSV